MIPGPRRVEEQGQGPGQLIALSCEDETGLDQLLMAMPGLELSGSKYSWGESERERGREREQKEGGQERSKRKTWSRRGHNGQIESW